MVTNGRTVLWRQAVTGTNLAVVMGGLGLLALATPAAYIAYQSRTSGESAAALTKVMSIHHVETVCDVGVFRDTSRVWCPAQTWRVTWTTPGGC